MEEGGVFVEIAVVKLGEDFPQVGFEFLEIQEDSDLVKSLAAHGHLHPPVVAVELLAGPLVAPKLVRGGKFVPYRELKHPSAQKPEKGHKDRKDRKSEPHEPLHEIETLL